MRKKQGWAVHHNWGNTDGVTDIEDNAICQTQTRTTQYYSSVETERADLIEVKSKGEKVGRFRRREGAWQVGSGESAPFSL